MRVGEYGKQTRPESRFAHGEEICGAFDASATGGNAHQDAIPESRDGRSRMSSRVHVGVGIVDRELQRAADGIERERRPRVTRRRAPRAAGEHRVSGQRHGCSEPVAGPRRRIDECREGSPTRNVEQVRHAPVGFARSADERTIARQSDRRAELRRILNRRAEPQRILWTRIVQLLELYTRLVVEDVHRVVTGFMQEPGNDMGAGRGQ
jgi:hypothetical protein